MKGSTSSNKTQPTSITDSAWYWVQLFCIAGLIALLLISSKYTQRQNQIEQNLQRRQLVARQLAGNAPADAVPPSPGALPTVPLWPLAVALGGTLVIAWSQLFRIGRH